MARSSVYQKNIIHKLLSSKFNYPKAGPSQPVKRIIIHGKGNLKNPEIGAIALQVLFDRRPSFQKIFRPREKEYRLNHLVLTSPACRVPGDLDILASTIIPFQLEHHTFTIKAPLTDEISCRVQNCIPATPLNPLFFPYPIVDERFNLTLVINPSSKASLVVDFYLNLFLIPVL
jgi:hypothetical protein